jgi:hypothetical protein
VASRFYGQPNSFDIAELAFFLVPAQVIAAFSSAVWLAEHAGEALDAGAEHKLVVGPEPVGKNTGVEAAEIELVAQVALVEVGEAAAGPVASAGLAGGAPGGTAITALSGSRKAASAVPGMGS